MHYLRLVCALVCKDYKIYAHTRTQVSVYNIMLIMAYLMLYHINGYSIDEQDYKLQGLLLNKKL